ncbi:phage antirepressor KilAC domain-containing protein [Paenibacillus sp. PAMC21692]|uniref:phage antirepressor KilAC domain-containing protein n=1 Tax=Paenibacillus sp. PAMC21692 TaxID=2762320 RepID=UPI00164EA881|nr:phage antirepressor KilAC domain-containing protein [Paenibacillus sp. PAMC21692]QNK54550.1 phage antirepressor KilAC domain-containing protein [Paenibacillus sp. PAMC21692]
MDNLLTISGVRGYVDETGTAQLNLEDVAAGLGIVKIDRKDGVEYERVNRQQLKAWLASFGISNSENELPTFIPENVFYRLAMKARNAVAETFQAKVADEILPAIRKHGGYLTPEKIEEALLNPDTLIQLATQLKTERAEKERLQLETERQAAVITEQAPKVEYHDQILASEGTVNVSQIAKDYAIIAQDLNLILKHEGVQFRRNKQWLLTAKYQSQGFTDSHTGLADNGFSYVNTKWTQAGRLFIHQLLTRKGIRPSLGPDSTGEAYIERLRKEEATRKQRKRPARRRAS